MKGFTTKRAEHQANVFIRLIEANVGRKTIRGFTLIEALVAITILTLAVSGSFLIANSAIISAGVSRDQLTASYLAQEGVEYVRMMRDNEYLAAYQAGGADVSDVAWTEFLEGTGVASISSCRTTNCLLDPTRPMGSGSGFSLQPCEGSSCTPLYVADGAYTQQNTIPGAVETPFTRTIRAVDMSAEEESIVATVSWSFHGIPYSVTVTDLLTSWQ